MDNDGYLKSEAKAKNVVDVHYRKQRYVKH